MMNILSRPLRLLRRISGHPLLFLEQNVSRQNTLLLTRLVAIFAVVLGIYSVTFHYLMLAEGRNFHWFVGVYWTIATMTTVGFGDVVFSTFPGMLFSVIVIISGIFFILVIIPFTLIQLFQSAARVPREAPKGSTGHVILTHYGPVTNVLIRKLGYYTSPYLMLTSDLKQAADFRDRGIRAVLGEIDDPQTYAQMAIGNAALLATTADDVTNTMVIHAVRQISSTVSILSTSTEQESIEILRAAGANEILSLDEMMGQSLARRTIAGDAIAHIIGQLGSLTIAEAAALATPLVNRKLKETQLHTLTGVVVIGILEGPDFFLPDADRVITKHSILILAGAAEAIMRYNELFCIYNSSDDPVIIIGAGNVGRWVARSFDEHGLEYCIMEKAEEKAADAPHVSILDAAKAENLAAAGFFKAPAVVISTHKDDTNIYLATLFRSLRPDIQIVSRATLDRNVSLLHRAGCDIVLSYASFGSNFILNHLKRGTYLMLSEGVDVFKVRTPERLVGRTIDDVRLRETIGCHVVAIVVGESTQLITGPDTVFPPDSEIILIGGNESESLFLKKYGREM
jgi:Trk K+ transport system NAD-binding subunit